MNTPQTFAVSRSLNRLRRSIGLCSIAVIIGLFINILVWAFAAFTAIRFENASDRSANVTVVSGDERQRAAEMPRVVVESVRVNSEAPPPTVPANVNRLYTMYDSIFSRTTTVATGFATVAMIAMLPLILAGLFLSSASATPGSDKTVSAFTWALLVAMLVLPVGQKLGLPWQDGALSSYQTIIQPINAATANSSDGAANFSDFSILVYARFLALPIACIVGVGLIALRFHDGVAAAILPNDSVRLDPTLEREAGNLKVSSLHGGRSAVALRTLTAAQTAAPVTPVQTPAPAPAPAAQVPVAPGAAATPGPTPSLSAPMSAGAPLRRLI
ncbi:MAG TPA: hypothetical protein VG711_02125 [Phycisphaerales bacterium]|nr:hypothetical protein [Phycisphaerales bacterium]